MRGKLMGRRNQIDQGKHPSLAQRVQDLVHAGNVQLAEATYLVEFLVVGGDPNASRLLWDYHQRARIRRGRLLDQVRHEVLIQGGVNSFGQVRLDAVGAGNDRRATFRERNLESHQGAGSKIDLRIGENVSKSTRTAQLFDC